MEKRILGLRLTGKVLYIVYYQSVYALIECEKVVYVLILRSCRKLAFKKPGGNVQHTRTRITFLDPDPYRLYKVSLADTRRTENK